MNYRNKAAEFAALDSDGIIKYLKEQGYSFGETGCEGCWLAFAESNGVRFEGTGDRQSEAWRDLIRSILLSRVFSRN